jgi:regulator of protease activity HflC (stomatin/prohibitin superfamily)
VLDKLIDLIIEFLADILPFQVIPHYDRGVRLRLGNPCGKELGPGLHWKIPFADNILSHMVKATTINLLEQTVTTKDYKSIVVKAVMKYEVSDVSTLLLEVNSAADALTDMVQGIIRDKIIDKNWNECNTQVLIGEISKRAKGEAKKWGLTILEITLTDLAEMKSIRLLNK